MCYLPILSYRLSLNSPNISLPILGDKPIHQYFPRRIIVLYGPAIDNSWYLNIKLTVLLESFDGKTISKKLVKYVQEIRPSTGRGQL